MGLRMASRYERVVVMTRGALNERSINWHFGSLDMFRSPALSYDVQCMSLTKTYHWVWRRIIVRFMKAEGMDW